MKVVKRDGQIVNFDLHRIVKAIENAMMDTINGIDKNLSNSIANEIKNKNYDIITVEQIQDLVEDVLMNSNRKDVAKKYILYRNDREKNRRKKMGKQTLLSDEFLADYKHKYSPMNQLGNFVYYRTYSRYLSGEERREYWWETVKRAVEYNCSLVQTSKEEAEKLFDNIYNLRQFLSGRTFWVGGTEVAKKFPMANFNCSFRVIDSFDAYKDMFYLLMLGTGFGFRVLKEDVDKLPKIRTNTKIMHQDYTSISKNRRQDNTSLNFFSNNTVEIIVGDSKEGWSQSIDFFFRILWDKDYKSIENIIFNYNHVRPKGEKLKTFGGTASGYESLKNMFNKIDKIIKNAGIKENKEDINLKPIDCMDIANIIGENVIVGGVRRTSENTLFGEDDVEIAQAKNNLYIQSNNDWVENNEISHRKMSNNSIFYVKKPTREKLHWQLQQMKYSGEPGFINAEAASKRRNNFNGVNPCFTGEMKLLTKDGYKTFQELEDQTVDLININGEISSGKVWSSGEKDTVQLTLSNNKFIICTPDHKFMTLDGDECMAKNLKNVKLMPKLSFEKEFDKEFIKFGFVQGDGCLGRLDSESHKGLEVNIGEKDSDILILFDKDRYTEGERKIYWQGNNTLLRQLGFCSEPLTNRIFPKTYKEWSLLKKASFLQGCFSANGGIIKNARVSYKATCEEFIKGLLNTLDNDFKIKAYITTNKAKNIHFANGDYECRESYDLNISNYDSLQIFQQEIGFFQNYKKIQLTNLLRQKVPYVRSIKPNGIKRVFDFSEPKTHWGVVEGFIVHNCFEILLDSKGLCNLTTINVMSFVKNGKIDQTNLLEAQKLSARAGYRMTMVEMELHDWNIINKRDRLVGCSLTGWQDMVDATQTNKEEEKELLKKLKDTAHIAVNEYAEQLCKNKPLLVCTIKPEGTLSLLAGVSPGLHYSHSPYYIRRVRINSNDPLVKVCEELNYKVLPEVNEDWETCNTKVVEFPTKAYASKTKFDVTAIQQLENYKMFMEYYVDHNASITVTVKENEWDDVEEWLWNNWDEIIAISFLSLSDSFYPLMPYELIDKNKYDKLNSEMKPFLASLISKYETEESEFDLDSSSCENGVCPVR